jgi:hypothetical protein
MIVESSPFIWFSTARRNTRRLIVALYWAIVLSLFGISQWCDVFRPGHMHAPDLLFPLYLIAFLPAILGGVRAGGMVKPFRGTHWVPLPERDYTQTLFGANRPLIGTMTSADLSLDERDLRDRDRVHFFAYTASRWLALVLLAAQSCAGLVSPVWMLRAGSAAFFLLTIVLWSLPQTLILWTEPDMEEEA